MRWFRRRIRASRLFILTLVALNLYTMIEGRNFVYAHEVRQQEQERHLRTFASLLGIPIETLRGPRETLLDRLDPLASRVEELVREAWDSIELPLPYLGQMALHQAPSGEDRSAAAAPQEPSGPASSPRRELDARLLERLERAVEDSEKERTAGAPEGAPTLPLRRMEKKARTEKASAVDERAASSAVAPTPEPRRVIAKDAPAPEIVALAHSFGDSPAASSASFTTRSTTTPSGGPASRPWARSTSAAERRGSRPGCSSSS